MQYQCPKCGQNSKGACLPCGQEFIDNGGGVHIDNDIIAWLNMEMKREAKKAELCKPETNHPRKILGQCIYCGLPATYMALGVVVCFTCALEIS